MAKHYYQTLYDCFGPEKDLCFLTAENIPRPHTKPISTMVLQVIEDGFRVDFGTLLGEMDIIGKT